MPAVPPQISSTKEEQMSQVVPGTRCATPRALPVDLSIDQEQIASLIRSVLSQVRGISRQDAEDAVQESWIVLAEKAEQLEPGPIGGYLMRTARFKAMQIRDKRRDAISLDTLMEIAGDGIGELPDTRFASPDTHAELAELANDPVSARALEAAYRRIETLTGVPAAALRNAESRSSCRGCTDAPRLIIREAPRERVDFDHRGSNLGRYSQRRQKAPIYGLFLRGAPLVICRR
jgi:DNA-directed RNA polymerase specialized sigma24 family protein